MQDQWFRTGEGFVLVYSIIERRSFEQILELRSKILRIQVRLSLSWWTWRLVSLTPFSPYRRPKQYLWF